MNAPASLPSWPALLRRDKAMAYLDLPRGRFEKALADGELPLPVTVAGQERWVRAQIDERLAELAGGKQDWRKDAPMYQGRSR